MPREIAHILHDILEAIEGIENAVRGKSFDEYCGDWLTRHGVQRGIEIISEASRHLPDTALAAIAIAPYTLALRLSA